MRDVSFVFKLKETLATNALAASDPDWTFKDTRELIDEDIKGICVSKKLEFVDTYLTKEDNKNAKEYDSYKDIRSKKQDTSVKSKHSKSHNDKFSKKRTFGMSSQVLKDLLSLDHEGILGDRDKCVSSTSVKDEKNSLWFRDRSLYELGTIDSSLYHLPSESKTIMWNSSVNNDSKIAYNQLQKADPTSRHKSIDDFKDCDPSASIRAFRKLSAGIDYSDEC